jgi:hypothetical protein
MVLELQVFTSKVPISRKGGSRHEVERIGSRPYARSVMFASPVTHASLAHLEAGRRLRNWLITIENLSQLQALNDRLQEMTSEVEDVLAPHLSDAAQRAVQLTHNADIGRLAYVARLGSESECVTEPAAVRQLLRRTRRSLLWRLANQNLFASVAQVLFLHVHEAMPDLLSVSNVKDGKAGEGGRFELWLPTAAIEPSAVTSADAAASLSFKDGHPRDLEGSPAVDDVALDAPAPSVHGGLLIGSCTFRVQAAEEGGGELELARIGAVVVLDLDRRRFAQCVDLLHGWLLVFGGLRWPLMASDCLWWPLMASDGL